MPRIQTNHALRLVLRLALAAILLPSIAALSTWAPAAADDHRAAPLITSNPLANITDIYAFVYPGNLSVTPAGPLSLVGTPFDPAMWGDSSMLLELGDDIPEPLTGPVTIPVQVTQLSLRSIEPITVTYPDGTTEQWDVDLGVSPTTPSAGTLDLSPQSADDGVFRIELPLYLQAVFSRVGDDEVRTVDYATQPTGAVQLGASGRFSLMCPPDRMTVAGVTTPFCLGHDRNAGGVLPVTLTDINDLSNPRFMTRVEPTPAPTATNNPPTLAPFGNKVLTEGSQAGGTLSASDPDGDNLAFSATGLPDFCTLTDRGNGAAVLICSPDAGAAGVYTITITVTDDGSPSLSDSETFTLTVLGTNQPPVLNPIGDRTAKENETTTFGVSASDPDDDILTVGAGGLPSGCSLNLTGSEPGFWIGFIQCDGDVMAGMYTATVTVTDSKGASDSETFTLTVQPFLDTGGDQTVVQGGQVQLNPTSSPGAVVELDLDNDGVFESPAPAIFDATGLTPGDYLVGVRAFLNGVFNTSSITVTVLPRNNPPVLAPIGQQRVTADDDLFNVMIAASDPDGDNLTFHSDDLPSFCLLIQTGPNTAVLDCEPISNAPLVVTKVITRLRSPSPTTAHLR